MAAGGGSQSYAGDPINARTGNFDYSLTDLSLQTIAGPLTFQRSYASQATDIYTGTTSILGPGWTHNQDTRLIFDTGAVWFKAHTANQYKFVDHGSHVYSPYPGVLATLTYSSTLDTYSLRTSAQSVYTFDAGGKLSHWRNELGYGFDYTYQDGKLSRVTEPLSGRYLQFNYVNGRLDTIADNTGREVSFGYDANGDLTSFTDVMDKTWSYEYDANHHLTYIKDPSDPPKTVLRIVYDVYGRAYEQFNGRGQRIVKIEYHPDRTSTMLDAYNRSSTLIYDGRNLNTGQIDAADYTTTKVYDSNFHPTLIVDEDDRQTEMTWSTDGANLLHVQDAEGYETSLEYDAQNHLTRVVAPQDRITRIAYDGTLPISNTLQAGTLVATTLYTYTTSADAPQPPGLLKAFTDPMTHTTRLAYDALGQLVAITDTLGHASHFLYDDLGRLSDASNAYGRVTHYEYYIDGNLHKITSNYAPARQQNDENQYNLVTEYFYDDFARLTQVKDTLDHTTTFSYDDAGRLEQVFDTYENPTTYTYYDDGQLESVSDRLSHVTRLEYDTAGRLWHITDPLTRTVTLAYNPDSTLLSVSRLGGYVVSYGYDDLKRTTGVSDNAGHEVGFTLDAYGNPLTRTDALGRVTRYEYNGLNLLAAVTENYLASPPQGYDPNETNVRTEYSYDKVGNLTRVKDANLHETVYEYDELNRLWKITDPLTNITEFGYDWLGNRTSVEDANGNTTIYHYNLVDRLETIDYPGGVTQDAIFSYDPLGRLTDLQDSLGQTHWAWDDLDRPTSITDPFGQIVGYGYDDESNLTGLTYPGERTISYEYNQANQLEHALDGETLLADYVYTDAGRLDTLTLANGVTSSYGYDTSGQLTSLTYQNQEEQIAAYAYHYDLAGNRDQIQESLQYPTHSHLPAVMHNGGEGGDGMQAMAEPSAYPGPEERSLDPQSLPSPLESAYPAPQETSPGAEILESTSQSPITPYPTPLEEDTSVIGSLWHGFVDFFARLFTWHTGAASAHEQPLQSDKIVNPARTSLEDSQTYSVTIDYDYDPLNRLIGTYPVGTGAIYSSGQVYTYTYDKVGNRSSLISPEGTTSYEYDEADRLVQVDDVDYTWDDNGNLLSDGVYTYTYDYDNRLTSATDGIDSFGFAYNALGDRYQQTANGETITYTLDIASDLSQVLMDGNNTYLYGLGRIAQESETHADYFLPDALGSVRQMTTQDGNIGLMQSFDPFGNPFSAMGPSDSNYGYAGEWTDDTDLVYLRARYYAPLHGQFVNRDPFPGFITQPGSLTPYVYALNNPVLLTDPSGENPLLLVGILGGLLGGAIYGYGSQVIRNLNKGMCFWDALTTNIDAGQVALYAVVGTLIGTGMGGAMVGIKALALYLGVGGNVVTILDADGNPTNEITTGTRIIQNVLTNIRNGIGQGFNTFKAFKNAQGQSGPGMAWHHIVEQTPKNIQQFGSQMIHNVNNLIRLPSGAGLLHQRISGYYSSIQPLVTGSDTLTIRLWLQTKSFEFQWVFGIELIKNMGGIKYIIEQFGD